MDKEIDISLKRNQAKEIIDNPLYKEIIDEIKDRIKTKWEATNDNKERENCWFLIRAVNSIDILIRNYTIEPNQEIDEQLKELLEELKNDEE